MYPQQIHQYVQQFFKETNCPIVYADDQVIQVQLTIDMDKKIMNRPFYWKYIESTDAEPNPALLTLMTNTNQLANNVRGEVLHFGSPRLSQLFQVTREMGSFVQMYEQVANDREPQLVLTPWLAVNYKVAYCSDQTKEMLYSLGMNLMTGQVVDGFHESLRVLKLDSTPPENAYPLPYIIKPLHALNRLDTQLDNFLLHEDHTWAEEAKQRWQKDCRVLAYFYEGVENKPESYAIEKEALDQQYAASIHVDIINGGLFYLK